MNSTDFKAPLDLHECEARRLALVAKAQALEAKLGEKGLCGPDGARMSREDYAAWRDGAKRTIAAAMQEVRFLKGWAAEQAKRIAGTPEGGSITYLALRTALEVLRRENAEDPLIPILEKRLRGL